MNTCNETAQDSLVTYCNPLPLPNYPRGRASRNRALMPSGFYGPPCDFRETADPSVLYDNGRWVLYVSAGMAYTSDDFVTWQHRPVEPPDIGYAPTVVRHRNRYLLTACGAPLYTADDALGPFAEQPRFMLPVGRPVPKWDDPMLFADGDDLYAYWGLGAGGIKGATLDPDRPWQLIDEPRVLFAFDPEHEWECHGEHHEDPTRSYVEGPWMLKHRGRYYLTYTAPGTEFSTYGMGVYVADHPLGPFHYQQRNPICYDRHGLVRGPGHGCIVEGPDQTLWAFYTCVCCVRHMFERRVGMDPAGFDENGQLFVRAASESPQLAPGIHPHPERGNNAGLLPVSHLRPGVIASSTHPHRSTIYATDDSMKTWWQPADDDPRPSLTIPLGGPYRIKSMRVIWAEPELDYAVGRVPRPIRYRLEYQHPDSDQWHLALDRSESDVELMIDYQAFPEVTAVAIRLLWNADDLTMSAGVTDLSVFGMHQKSITRGR